MTQELLHSPATERNKKPILEVLRHVLPSAGLVLEVASGTGQHVVHFARELPKLVWQPTDPDEGSRAAIVARLRAANLDNVKEPISLDVLYTPWPVDRSDAILCINMITFFLLRVYFIYTAHIANQVATQKPATSLSTHPYVLAIQNGGLETWKTLPVLPRCKDSFWKPQWICQPIISV